MFVEVYTAIPGDPMMHEHEVEVFIGDWRAFARCGCGWHTNNIRRWYSPLLDEREQSFIRYHLSEAGQDHKFRMERWPLRLKRAWASWREAIKDAWEDTASKYKLGEHHEH